MLSWLLVGALYCAGIGFFHLVGGVNSAAEAIRRWGESNGRRRGPRMVDRMRRTVS